MENTAACLDTQRIGAQLRKWRERLIDQTKANPLLGINRSRVSKLKIIDPQASTLFDLFVVDEKTLKMPLVRKEAKPAGLLIDSKVEQLEFEYKIEPGDLTFDIKPVDLHRKLHRIYDNSRTTIVERGVTTLYLSFGVLKWTDNKLGESISPLWMIPCQFESFGPNASLRLSQADEEALLNPALELYLRERQHVILPPIIEDPKAGSLSEWLASVQDKVNEYQFKVEQEVWISTYTFESLVIYQDIGAMADIAKSNPIIAILSRAASVPEHSEKLDEEILDDLPTPEKVPLPVLATDSSQLKALSLASTGHNTLIYGPPGTGKSQTISNLIADSLRHNKKVLFVSAKMAALNIVYGRLNRLGLGQFCLEAHSTKAGKIKIIEDLKKTLEASSGGGSEFLEEQLEELLHTRSQLNEYVRELHKRREPLGRTIYHAIGRITKLWNAPDIIFQLPWVDPVTVTRNDLSNILAALQDLGAQAGVFDKRASHPWRGLLLQPWNAMRHEEIKEALVSIQKHGKQLFVELNGMIELIGPGIITISIKEAQRLASTLERLADTARLPSAWATRSIEDIKASIKLFDIAKKNADEFTSRRAEYSIYLDLPYHEAINKLGLGYDKFKSWTRIMRPEYWRWRRQVCRALNSGIRADYHSLCSYYELAKKLINLEKWFETFENSLTQEVSVDELYDAKAYFIVTNAFRVVLTFRQEAEAIGISLPQASPMLTNEVRRQAGKVAVLSVDQELVKAIGSIDEAWTEGFADKNKACEARLPNLLSRCEELLTAMPKIHEWLILQHTIENCRKLNLLSFLDNLDSVSAKLAAAAFERRFYICWVYSFIQRSSSLATFIGVRREELINQFQDLDKSIQESVLKRTIMVASDPARKIASAQNNLGHAGEVGILRHELGKRKRIKPLRKLFAEVPNILQALKPCMLMSPLSVSSYLKPGTITFDLAIFDEASQLPTQEAVPSILRAKQIIVAGDSKQLPPTSFFNASIIFDDEVEEEGIAEGTEPLESLLDECEAFVPFFIPTKLLWHYRSRDDRLINFSNHYFYNNELITFPSVSIDAIDQGVRIEYVPNGIWDRGKSRTNRSEAHRVANLIIEQFRSHPDRSIGVAAMNVTQREAIEEALEEQMQGQFDLAPLFDASREEPFFIKALENVQGDERDTIIISIGYGRTSDGALPFGFGPLNQEGGWRRLNVLITRAKWQVILVTSMRSNELAGVNPNNRGAIALRNFIAYAEQSGVLPTLTPVLTGGETNEFEDAVAEALRERGFLVDQQVGASQYRIDIAVRDPRCKNRYLIGVEFDGATYHSSKTARDRDLLRQQVLNEKGWRLHRIWSIDWFKDQENAINGVLKSIEAALQAPPDASIIGPEGKADIHENSLLPKVNQVKDAPEVLISNASPRYPNGAPYKKFHSNQKNDRNQILNPKKVGHLVKKVIEVVNYEGPIHMDLLLERLKEIFGIERAGSNVQANINKAIKMAIRSYGLERSSSFIRVVGKSIKTFRSPGDGVNRSLNEIICEEIELAILFTVENQFGYQREALPQAVARLFEFKRTPSDALEIIGDVVDSLIEKGRLRLSGPNVYLAR